MNGIEKRRKNANSTLRASRAVPHPSTDRAFQRLTSEFRWDRVHSMKYGRWRQLRPNDMLQTESINVNQNQISKNESSAHTGHAAWVSTFANVMYLKIHPKKPSLGAILPHTPVT